MTFEDLKFRLGWFDREAGRIERARDSLSKALGDVEEVRLDVSEDTMIGQAKQYFDQVMSAITHDAGSSIDAGVTALQDFEDAIRETGRNYLVAESQNEDYADDINRMLEETGL